MTPEMDPLGQINLLFLNQIPRVSELEDLSSNPLRLISKVGKAHDRILGPHALIPQHLLIMRPKPDQAPAFQRIRLFAQSDEVLEAGIDPSSGCRSVVAVGVGIGRIRWSIDPARVVPSSRIVHVGVIVHLADLVPEVDKRDAAGRHDDAVPEQDSLYCAIFPGFEPGKGSGCTADPAVACFRVVLEWHTSSE